MFTAEGYFHFFKPQKIHSSLPKEMDCYIADKVLFAVFKPNSNCIIKTSEFEIKNRINNLGFRGEHLEIDKAKEIKRIAFIGDSYILGWGVKENESFAELLGNKLLSTGINAEIINAGVPGVGVDYYYLTLKNKIIPLKPDVVMIGIYLANDLSDFNYFQWTVSDKELPVKIDSLLEFVDTDNTRRLKALPSRYKWPVLRNSHLFIFFTNFLFGEIGKIFEINPHSSGTNCLVKHNCHELDSQIEKFKKIILEMQNLAQENKFSLEVILIPWEAQLPRNLTRRSEFNVIVPDQNRHIINNTMDQFFEDNNINYIDLLNSFESYSGPDQVFYPIDKHWTKAGHQIAAEAILPDIIKLLEPSN